MALAVLSNQVDQGVTINQNTVLASSKRSGTQREGLIGKNHCSVMPLGFHASQGFKNHPLANPSLLTIQPTHPLLVASGQ